MLKDVTSRISFSKVQTYLQCPYKWKLQYYDKIQIKKQSIQLLYGTAVHQVIQQFLIHYYSDYTIAYIKQNTKALVSQYTDFLIERLLCNLWEKQKADPTFSIPDEVLQTHVQFAVNTLVQFIPNCHKYFPKQATELVGVQFELNYPMEDIELPFNGYIDVLLRDKKSGQYTIYDLKTSRMGWKDKQKKDEGKRLQLLLYKHFLSKQLGVPTSLINVEFLILKKMVYENSDYKISRMQKFVPPSSSVTMKKAMKLFQDAIISMQQLCENPEQNVVKNVTGLCNYCPYKKTVIKGKVLCDQGRVLKSQKSNQLISQ